LQVGRVARAHGLRGGVVVELVSNRPERTRSGAVLVLDRSGPAAGTEPSDPSVPRATLTVISARPLPPGGGPGSRWLVQFAEVSGREEAEALRGAVLLAPPLGDEDVLWVHELVGCQVVDVAGTLVGTVAAVLANPASDLLELTDGRLIPLRFVTTRHPGRIEVDPPAGLLD
jgi:16S rRNA processing protein RimM